MYFLLEAFLLLTMFSIYWCLRRRRRYYKQRIGKECFRNLFCVVRNLAFMLKRKSIEIKGDLNKLRSGGILYSFHFGIWELMPTALRHQGYDIGVIVNRYYDHHKKFLTRIIDNLLYKFRNHQGVRIFYRDQAAQIVKFLKRGGLLGVLVDGNNFYSKFDKVKRLSELTGKPLIPFAAYRKNGYGILEIDCKLDELVAQRKYDYLWFYRSRSR